ncbi:hypothetical protein ABID95_008049 [Streptomyces atratus]|uniref:PIN-like domain-containing protein n=1 Tax=Streptomyces atratus TaxID=1893 RepID=UPI0033910B37
MSSYEADPAGSSRHLRLTDGFEYYLSASLADYERVLKNGMVALDTNAILNLYRYTDKARKDLFGVLRSLGDRLWIPHQVAVEFWRNRESAASDLDFFGDTVVEELQEFHNQIERSLRTWANRVALGQDHLHRILEDLGPAFDGVSVKVQEFAGERSEGRSRNTYEDPVLLELQEILENKVGAPMEPDEYERAIAEGLRRVDERIPPGYKDKKKGDADSAGDYLVWAQTIKEARLRGCEVLIITGDVKEDWWRRESGEVRGPRLELSKEFHSSAGSRLYMLRPPRFLELAREALDVSVANETINDASRVELNAYAIRERMDTASGILASLRSDLLAYIQNEPRLPLVDDSIDSLGNFPVMVAMFYKEVLVYLNFAHPAARMLRRWKSKVSGRKNLRLEEITFAVAPLSEDQLNDRLLLEGMIDGDRPAWNYNGFGNHDPGRSRVHAPLRDDHFDMLHPIDLSFEVPRLTEVETVGQLVDVLREDLPYRVYVVHRSIANFTGQPIDKSSLDGTVESALRALAASLSAQWQITAMPGLITIEPVISDVRGAQQVWRGSL